VTFFLVPHIEHAAALRRKPGVTASSVVFWPISARVAVSSVMATHPSQIGSGDKRTNNDRTSWNNAICFLQPLTQPHHSTGLRASTNSQGTW
jgi:hypothetical protein